MNLLKMFVYSVIFAAFLSHDLIASGGGGDLMEISPVTDRILMIHIRDGHIITYGLHERPTNQKHPTRLHQGQTLDEAGCKLSVTASENTRRIEYYAGWRFIGESEEAESGFELVWNPAELLLDQELLITAVAYSDRGRRSLPSDRGEARITISDDSTCGVRDDRPSESMKNRLYQNYPNPFRYNTIIRFDLPHPVMVTMNVYNLSGQKHVTLADEPKSSS